MFENDYYTARNYEENNNLYINDFENNNINNRRSNTQNYFFNNNQNNMSDDELNYENNNLNEDYMNNENLYNMNQNDNQYNTGIETFKNRINKLQRKVGKLNKYRNEIQEAISYNMDNNNYLNRTQNYLDNYENNHYFDENERQGLKCNKSFDVFKMNYNNYDFLFDSQNNNEEENNSSNNFMEQEEDQLDNEDTNLIINSPNNEFNMNYNNQNDDNSFVGFYDNIFTSKNVNIDKNIQKINKINNDIPINDEINKNDYKNIQLYEQNYQFNIPKTINNNIIKETNVNKNKSNMDNNIQIVSNELSIIGKENKKNNINNINNNKDINNLNFNQNNAKADDVTNEKSNEFKNVDEMRQKELEKYDSIIAQAKELNNQFQTEKNNYQNKNNEFNYNTKVINNKKFENNRQEENIKESNKIKINPETNNIINIKKNEKKNKKIIDKNKKVSFDEEKIYIKYNQDDYIVKINVFNNKKAKINFITHDLKKYIHKLKKNELLEPAIINCPEIDYQSISSKMINLVKKENKVQSQNPRIDNKVNKSIKNPRIKINKPENKKEIKNNINIDKIKKKPINNNIKIIKNNNQMIKNEKNNKSIPQKNLSKPKIMKKNKIENKQIKRQENSKNKKEKEKEKNENNNLNIFDNPQFIEGQKAINNLKKFFAEYSLEDEKNE